MTSPGASGSPQKQVFPFDKEDFATLHRQLKHWEVWDHDDAAALLDYTEALVKILRTIVEDAPGLAPFNREAASRLLR
jgi:hypothetical protein